MVQYADCPTDSRGSNVTKNASTPDTGGSLVRIMLREFGGRLWRRSRTEPIDSLAALSRFVATRSSYVAQKTLYGYLKARMGTRYPSMFENEVFVQSINIAKFNLFAACLSDLTIYSVAHATKDLGGTPSLRRTIALECYAEALRENNAEAPPEFDRKEAVASFTRRLDETDWRYAALQRENFTHSPRALYRWAPIAPELKSDDTDILANSISFAWSEVRQGFLRTLDVDAVRREINEADAR